MARDTLSHRSPLAHSISIKGFFGKNHKLSQNERDFAAYIALHESQNTKHNLGFPGYSHVISEEEEMKKAEQDKGDEKAKIFDSIKQQEAELRQQKEAIKAATLQTEDTNKGTGSVWNPNSYFWEEKNLNKWSQEKIQEFLGSFIHTVPGGSLKVTQWDVTGDSSVSIRKGKKIVVFDYEIDLKWKADLKEGDDEQVVTGHFKIPEMSNLVYEEEEDIEDYCEDCE